MTSFDRLFEGCTCTQTSMSVYMCVCKHGNSLPPGCWHTTPAHCRDHFGCTSASSHAHAWSHSTARAYTVHGHTGMWDNTRGTHACTYCTYSISQHTDNSGAMITISAYQQHTLIPFKVQCSTMVCLLSRVVFVASKT